MSQPAPTPALLLTVGCARADTLDGGARIPEFSCAVAAISEGIVRELRYPKYP